MGRRDPRRRATPAEPAGGAPGVPVRSCVACRRRAPKRELLRWTPDRDGVPRPDPAARAEGRGAYVCRTAECVDRLARRAGGGGADAEAVRAAFRLAIGGGLVQNVPGELHEN